MAFCGTLGDLGGVELQLVTGGTAGSGQWNGLMQAYHPLGSGPLCGAQLRYLIVCRRLGVIGGLSVSAPAWRLSARDAWLGWSDGKRGEQLEGIVCNSRFLIVPRVVVKNLASHALGLLARRIAADWRQPLRHLAVADGDLRRGHALGHGLSRGQLDRGRPDPRAAAARTAITPPPCRSSGSSCGCSTRRP